MMTELVTKTNSLPKRSTQRKQNKLGPYNLLQTLGEGEFGKVKLGIHSKTGEEVAIKLIRKDGIGSDNRINKVEREISILKNLNHPHIVKLYNVLETEKYVGLVLEYASGGELFEYILAHRYLKEKDAKRFFAQIISSVQYMHKCKIVHRDLKLENILIDKNRNIIVTDFGFANQFSTAADDMMSTTCGSPCYAAPELVVNAGLYAGSAVDIWSCGVILFAMLCGFLPFDDDPSNPDSDDINLLYRYILSTRLIFPSHISSEACDLMEKMLVPDPAKRCTLDSVIQHPWLQDYKDFLKVNKSSPERFSTLPKSNSTKRTHASIKHDRYTPVINDIFMNKQLPEMPVSEPLSVKKITSPAYYKKTEKPSRTHSIKSSKIPNFITRKPIRDVVSPLILPETITSTENRPEKSLSTTHIPTETIKNPTGSVRIYPHKERFLGFFGKSTLKSNEEIEHSETSTLGNSSSSLNMPHSAEEGLATKSIFMRLAEDNSQPSIASESGFASSTHSSLSFRDAKPRRTVTLSHRVNRNSIFQQGSNALSNDNASVFSSGGQNGPETTHSTRFTMGDKAMAAVRKSIYRRTKSPPPPHTGESTKSSLISFTKHSEQPKSQRNTWSNPMDRASSRQQQIQQTKKTGKKMMDWIKKRSQGKQSETAIQKKEPRVIIQSDNDILYPVSQASTSGRGRTLSSNALAFVKEEESLSDIRIQIHQGPIDRTALTSRPPQKVIKDVSRILRILGIEAISDDEDGPFVLKCSRRKSSKRKEEGELQPIYGEASIDNGEEIRFIVEICRFKNLPGLFIVNVKRLKGNVWAYKFLYHKLIDFLDLNKEDYMQKK
ncbi:hypothetical protein G6F61_006591 [Rhizopus arrhizus]|nr:hypothetical protein G6F61_006591 [Rhizopus arrhizus]